MADQPTKTALAKAAGISITTLNRYLAGGASSPETQVAIETAASRIGYNLVTESPEAPDAPFVSEPRPALSPEAVEDVKPVELPKNTAKAGTLNDGRTYKVLTVAETGKPRMSNTHTHTLVISRPIVGGSNETKFALAAEPTVSEIIRMAG